MLLRQLRGQSLEAKVNDKRETIWKENKPQGGLLPYRPQLQELHSGQLYYVSCLKRSCKRILCLDQQIYWGQKEGGKASELPLRSFSSLLLDCSTWTSWATLEEIRASRGPAQSMLCAADSSKVLYVYVWRRRRLGQRWL